MCLLATFEFVVHDVFSSARNATADLFASFASVELVYETVWALLPAAKGAGTAWLQGCSPLHVAHLYKHSSMFQCQRLPRSFGQHPLEQQC